ncbi:MAG: TetR/AcrR family transcriptional regulator [Polyangiales bacterium]
MVLSIRRLLRRLQRMLESNNIRIQTGAMAKRIPKQSRSIEKYEAIVRASSRIIEKGAFASASTHAIAKRAGVGVGTLYEYFDGKDDILRAVVEFESRTIWRRIEQRIPTWTTMDGATAFEELVRELMDIAVERRGLVKVMLGQVPDVMSQEPVVRLLGQGEVLVKLLLVREARTPNARRTDTNAFILVNSLAGLMLGVARGLPPSVTADDVAAQIGSLLRTLVEHRGSLF